MAIQIVKLGSIGAEQTLPSESRINNQGSDTPFFNDSRSASKKLHVDYIVTKGNWGYSWTVISEDDYDFINAIVQLQYSSGISLSYIYTNQNGTEIPKVVRATITEKGALIPRDEYFYSGCSLQLEEV